MAFFLLAGFLLLGLAPSIHWLDTGELSLAAASLGIGHPPGQVPHTQLSLLAQFAPFGDLSFRAGLLSLVMGLVTFQVVVRLQSLKTAVNEWALVFFVLTAAISMQVLRVEVYSLVTLGVLASIYLSERSESDPRFLAAGAFVWGISAATHPVIALCALPFLWRRGIIRFLPLAILPVICLLYLPIRAGSGAQWNFGNPSNYDRLSYFVQGKLYKAYVNPQSSETLSHLRAIIQLFWQELFGIGFVFSLVGVVVGWRRSRAWTLRLIIGIGLCIFPLAAMGNFWPDNPDALGYLGPAFWLLAAASGLGIHWALARSNTLFRTMVAGCLLLALACQIALFMIGGRLTADWSAHRQSSLLLEEPPAASLVRIASFQTLGLMRTLQVLEGLRPDLDLVYRGLSVEQMPRVTDLMTSPGFDREEVWELAIYKDSSGRYRLRDEDLSRLATLRVEGWFCPSIGKDGADWLAKMRERTHKIRENVAPQVKSADEHLLLNYLVHLMLYRAKKDYVEERALVGEIRSLFPGFEDQGVLAGL